MKFCQNHIYGDELTIDSFEFHVSFVGVTGACASVTDQV